jgi:hypothetical protein
MIALGLEHLKIIERPLQCFREFTHPADHFVGFRRRGNSLARNCSDECAGISRGFFFSLFSILDSWPSPLSHEHFFA